ncbi:MAG: hypothetical protein ABFR63_05605 [Thermodesulfobacteriota bacterium]
MAEIRSTMDMVMERAAKMAARAKDVPADQAAEEQGMRLVAEFLGGGESQPIDLLRQGDPAEQMALRRGMARGLLRNIVLPRDEDLMEASKKATAGILNLGEAAGDITSVCNEFQQILDQYSGHREQVKQQLDDSIRTQLAQQLQQQGGQVPDMEAIDPSLHPQYRQEWERALGDLNEQYSQALEQRKEILMQRFS